MTQPDHEVVIIGAGLSGIGMAIALREAGIDDVVLLERAADVGGTWRDNTYPGIAVDVPAQAYQFRFKLNPEWSRGFAPGVEVKAYIDRLAEDYGIRPLVRFGAEVTSRTWDADDELWRLALGGDEPGEVTARFVVSAIGAFVDPKPVDITGVDDFAGKLMPSARWDHDYDLTGKRVAVIGTGASAVQIIPEIVEQVAHLDVYQRTPIWVGPKLDPKTPPWLRGVYRRFPPLQRVVRNASARVMELLLLDAIVHYPRAKHISRPLAAIGRQVWYRSQVRDPEVRRKLTPHYAIGCKRPSVSSTYLRTFNRDDVELVTDTIERITPGGVRTVDGVERPVDVLVLATGFRLASDPENFRRTPVRGRDGFDLATAYTEHRLRSYEGVAIPGLPNHFMIFGPYGWTGGTWHDLVETASAHIARIIGETRRRRSTYVEVRDEAADRWTEQMRHNLSTSLWHSGDCTGAHSYYFDHHGDTPYLRPTSTRQARIAARSFPFDDYVFVSPTPGGELHGRDHREHTGTNGADAPDRVRVPD
jgi:cation diffusion facilitator CzcD-associated flavoprotein CzcO